MAWRPNNKITRPDEKKKQQEFRDEKKEQKLRRIHRDGLQRCLSKNNWWRLRLLACIEFGLIMTKGFRKSAESSDGSCHLLWPISQCGCVRNVARVC